VGCDPYGQCDARPTVTFQLQSITTHWLTPNYTGWWQRHMDVNNLPRVVTWYRNGRNRTRNRSVTKPGLTAIQNAKRTESASGWGVAIATVVSAEPLGIRRLGVATFLVVLLHEWLRLIPLQLHELYLVEQDSFLRQLEVRCLRENTQNIRSQYVGSNSMLSASHSDATDITTLARLSRENQPTIRSRTSPQWDLSAE